MHRRLSLLTALLAGLAAAQTVPPSLNSVSNPDIVTLAKAGFNEDFIVDFISASRTRFDVSVNGLAGLAKDGLSERLIRAMLAAGSPQQVPPQQSAMISAMAMADMATPVRARKVSASAMAMSTQTPYYQSSTFLWGLIRRQVKIYATPQSERSQSYQLGSAYGQVRVMAPSAMGARYVVIP